MRFAGATALLVAAFWFAGLEPAAAETKRVKQTFDVSVVCSPPSTTCPQDFRKRVHTAGVFKLKFIASPLHCTPIYASLFGDDRRELLLDGGDHGPLDPGESTGWVNLSGAAPGGITAIVGNVQDAPGGTCPDGPISSWEGKLKVMTSKRV